MIAPGISGSMPSNSWTVTALPEEVPVLRRSAVRFAQMNGVPEHALGALSLAISEAVTNAVVHAFRDREHPGTVTVSIEIRPEDIAEVIVRDDGMGMSRRADSPGLGLGLGLIASVADQVEQRRPHDAPGLEIWMAFRLNVG